MGLNVSIHLAFKGGNMNGKVFFTDNHPELPDPLPCPFCGREPVIQHDRSNADEAGRERIYALEVICNTWGLPIIHI